MASGLMRMYTRIYRALARPSGVCPSSPRLLHRFLACCSLAPCRRPHASMLAVNTCVSSFDNQYGLEYACLKASTTILQLSCFQDFSCSSNSASGSCDLNVLQSGQCIFSSSRQLWARISCASAVSTPTFIIAQPPGRQLRGDGDQLLEEESA